MRLIRLSCLLLAAAVATATLGGAEATPAFPNATRALPPPAGEDHDALSNAIADAGRSAKNKARDVWRHPAESLTFWGLQPGDVVLELDPGGGYWAEILTAFTRSTDGRYAGQRSSEVIAAPPAAGSVDFILTGREIHNYIRRGNLDQVMSASFAALKPGGVLAVEEHRADPRPMAKDAADGYVSEAAVIAAAQKAGLRLDARSEINANPKDSKDHPFGVWTLPPDLRSSPIGQPVDPAFDHAKYAAIGESDRMTLRFKKPR
jgi:predicted methyltransferase